MNEDKTDDTLKNVKELNKDTKDVGTDTATETGEPNDTKVEVGKNKGSTQEELDQIVQEIGIGLANEEDKGEEMEENDDVEDAEKEELEEITDIEDKEIIGKCDEKCYMCKGTGWGDAGFSLCGG